MLIKSKIENRKTAPPENLKGILWSKNIIDVDLEKDKIYIIHQVLSFGDIEEIEWLFKNYTLDEINMIFINIPKRIYTRPVFLFIKDFILKINISLDEKKYVKSFF
jgi:hypothetical protein